MLGPARALLQTLYMPGVIALFPAIEGLGRDAIAAGETSIVIVAVIVVKPL